MHEQYTGFVSRGNLVHQAGCEHDAADSQAATLEVLDARYQIGFDHQFAITTLNSQRRFTVAPAQIDQKIRDCDITLIRAH